MKLQNQPTLADSICDVRARKVKKTFFTQINSLIDWDSISSIINKDYLKGKSATGKPSYDGLLLFKMCLLQSWY
jgi:IS5 family transposase